MPCRFRPSIWEMSKLFHLLVVQFCWDCAVHSRSRLTGVEFNLNLVFCYCSPSISTVNMLCMLRCFLLTTVINSGYLSHCSILVYLNQSCHFWSFFQKKSNLCQQHWHELNILFYFASLYLTLKRISEDQEQFLILTPAAFWHHQPSH